MFKVSQPLLGGLLWKRSWRMSRPQKQRLRGRLTQIDKVIETVTTGLKQELLKTQSLGEPLILPQIVKDLNNSKIFPKESQMLPRDKYTVFDKKVRGYRKSVHHVPKWTKISQRTNPENY
ncbi:hypothetical protein TBLA_0H00400 [Henningerozyma blattae CBS 6284]|uniref:54S ribosomal protein L31, mitochondrial n=1 Tax=Henningerozyma blattae (strain ATCC 34711 / CBS 6284 / DSM 70876 / NBRC 10599 / NRRL Y-10934 / UCD 77-7) TaxID=1071380 RepID=I2H7I1_HENB6|nr:hypothetical protein TBLA_0H00400 [Tetrapisispora blattae CBS 6284]CCH62333.1 hypothetical protein TBLA_0H00400 [Tetrapisispora blattae CBS 6284]